MSKREPIEIKQIRTVWNENERKWYFVIADVVQALSKNRYPKDYTKKLRKFDRELAKVWHKLVTPLEVNTRGGRQKMNCANAAGMASIILSVHSPKAKLFLKWIDSLNIDPFEKHAKIELSKQSMDEFYQILSNPDNWKRKRAQYSLINEKRPTFRKMNELELIFALLEEDDIIYKKGLTSQKKSRNK